MCGIVCYIGPREAAPILLEGLKRLEYRGYDSAGLAVADGENTCLVKEVGKVSRLEEKAREAGPRGTMGIAHTRWATHGKPSVANAHPQTGENDKIFLVHNGIIENYLVLKEELKKEGHTFKSETDTEVLVHLIEEYYEGDLAAAVKKVLGVVRGTFGIALFHRDSPDRIVLARRGSPLILGIGKGEFLAASDVNALIRHTNQVIHLKDNELAVLNATTTRSATSRTGWWSGRPRRSSGGRMPPIRRVTSILCSRRSSSSPTRWRTPCGGGSSRGRGSPGWADWRGSSTG